LSGAVIRIASNVTGASVGDLARRLAERIPYRRSAAVGCGSALDLVASSRQSEPVTCRRRCTHAAVAKPQRKSAGRAALGARSFTILVAKEVFLAAGAWAGERLCFSDI
jgi:hypothetical protein